MSRQFPSLTAHRENVVLTSAPIKEARENEFRRIHTEYSKLY